MLKKKILLIIFLICVSGRSGAFGAAAPIQNIQPISAVNTSPVQPQQINFEICNKFFKVDKQKLFYLTLSSINANRFSIDEIQTKSGYVVFTAANRQFLANVIKVDSTTSMLKITPCDNIYYFPIGVVQNCFKYIELNLNASVEKINTI